MLAAADRPRVVERLDELHDKVIKGEPSGLEGKAAGVVITGDSDGAQSIIAALANFFNAIGLNLPPYATLSVLWAEQAKGKDTTREELYAKYEKDYAATADKMINQLKTARVAAAAGYRAAAATLAVLRWVFILSAVAA